MTPEELSQVPLAYHPWYGQLVWTKDVHSLARKGMVAGGVNGDGYRNVGINGKRFKCHRLIWIMFYGSIPEGMEIDHRDGDKDNNRINNLRLATRSKNKFNAQKNANNTSGVKGIHWNKRDKLWQARIMVKGFTYQKFFVDLEVGKEWIVAMRQWLHGEFTNHGIHLKDSQ